MASVLKLRRGTTAQNDSFTGQEGEVTYDTQRKELRLHDGSTAGGFVIQNATTSSGVDGLQYYAANNTLVLTTPAGDSFQAEISLFSGDDVDIGNANTDTLTINSRIDSNLVPAANVTYDLGTSTHRWKDLWLSGSTINLGTATITAAANGSILLPEGSGISGQTDLATQTYVDTAVANLVDTAPAALDTLNELAAALNDDANAFTTLNTNISQKLGATATVALTGDVTASATAFSSNSVSLTTTLADTGTATGVFGSSTKIPVITVNSKGQITSISNTTVAGVTGVTYTTANNNLRVSVADGTTFDTQVGSSGYIYSTILEFPTGDYNGDDTYVGQTVTIDAFSVNISAAYDCMEPNGSIVTEDLGALS